MASVLLADVAIAIQDTFTCGVTLAMSSAAPYSSMNVASAALANVDMSTTSSM